MSSVVVSQRIAAMAAEFEAMLAEPVDGTAGERAAATADFERLVRRLPTMQHRLVNALAEIPAAELGESSVAAALSTLLRISRKEANRRVRDANQLGPRTAMTGEPLDPVLATTAAAQQRGDIGFEHVTILVTFAKQLPGFIDHDTRQAAEAQLAELACGLGPEALGKAAERLAMLLDQDGELTDADRAKRCYLTVGKQRRDGTAPVNGVLDPEGLALWQAVAAKLAAPGMCHPDDQSPCVDSEPTADARTSDLRTTGQRNHDALKAVLRAMLASGQLGSHKGLPATMVITTTLHELESGIGHAVTGGGTVLPMREVIRLASAAHHYLCVFDDHIEQPLYLGRAKRLATKAQRLALYSRDRGCTAPGCTASAYWTEVHHDQGWAAGHAPTNVDEMTLACPADHKKLDNTGWTTRKRADGRTEWLPPPNLDTGQTRINNYHHPERYLIPNEHDSRKSENGADDESDKP